VCTPASSTKPDDVPVVNAVAAKATNVVTIVQLHPAAAVAAAEAEQSEVLHPHRVLADVENSRIVPTRRKT